MPCASNWCSSARRKAGVKNDECMAGLVKFSREHISPSLLKGFLMASWTEAPGPGSNYLESNIAGIDQLAAALKS